ncbi:MAG: TrpB-like pyridoxal phosphate-dependent enzyme [Candidatus Theseobacter exili]|nr:TrpB-like pyridoxal phosphate-dependent enzyme [Candidatus Theseobacter exili]
MSEKKIYLSEAEMPQEWYNIQADLPAPLQPPLNPGTGQPIGPEDLAPIFPMELIKQEVSQERWIPIPDEIQRIYKIWRPTPLHRATELEKALKTPARIYYKNESVSPPGSHKPNTAVAQAYYNKAEGVRRIATETGAGQWGSALAFGTSLFGLECKVYMVKTSFYQKPYRKILMRAWGAHCIPSPSSETKSGQKILEEFPDTPGSLGMAISEAVEDAATHDDTKYALGSVLNHVILHQTITGLEIKKQMKIAGDSPDIIVGCVGGGSNFAGFAFPYVKDKLDGKDLQIIGVEPWACPSMSKGSFRYDFGDTAQLTPLLKMYTLGHSFVPADIHAGGLRYHGCSPLVSLLVDQGVIEPRAYHQNAIFKAALLFAETEGIIPAPETAHAIKGAIDEALKCKENNQEKCIVIGFSGHGHFDLASYDAYMDGKLKDYEHPAEKIKEALEKVPTL